MSTEVITAIGLAVCTIVTAIGTVVIKLNQIHSLVNSRLTEALEEITQLRIKVTQLEKIEIVVKK